MLIVSILFTPLIEGMGNDRISKKSELGVLGDAEREISWGL